MPGFTIPADHPSLPGHFPGQPVVPGVVLLAEILACIATAHPGSRIDGFQQIKFLSLVLPGQQVEVALQPPSEGRLGFSASVAGRPVLRGSLALHPA